MKITLIPALFVTFIGGLSFYRNHSGLRPLLRTHSRARFKAAWESFPAGCVEAEQTRYRLFLTWTTN